MTPALDADAWRTLLDRTDDPPTYGALVDTVGRADMIDTNAEDLVAAALADGPLVEDPDAGMFGEIHVAGDTNTNTDDDATDETPGSVEYAGEDTDPPGSTPGGETPETPVREGFNQLEGPVDPAVLVNGESDTGDAVDTWDAVDFADTEPDTYPPTLLDREQWMGRLAGEKLPFAPWGDPDHPDAPAEKDARYKWGLSENYVDGDTVALAEDDHRLDGRVFIQRETDPFAFVDGDDVRDPDTGEVHPVFRALLEHLGATYADVSTSGAGVHAYYHAPDGLPIEGKGQATFEIDTEPWGANDAAPTVEIYANTHVNVTTGEHVRETPTDLAEWDTDALRAILEAHGYDDKQPVSHDTDRDRPDLEEYDPTATDRNETTDEIRDVLHAVDRLDAADLPLRTQQTGADATGWQTYDPSYRTSKSGESVHSPPDEPVFHDHKEGESFDVLGLFAAEQGIITTPWDRLEGSDWFDAVDAARNAGAPIPEYDGDGDADADPVAVLPPAVRDLATAASGWDWKHAARNTDLTKEDVQDRTADTIAEAYRRGENVLATVLPAGGKTYGAVLAAARTGEPVSILTGRGRKEQYDQLAEWCEEHGLTYKILPSFAEDCPTANGDHGENWADTVGKWYRAGATPKQIHMYAEDTLGHPLPCQIDDDGNHVGCEYAHKWDFDPETGGSADPEEDIPVDVLIGHYTHAYREEKVVHGRTVAVDEHPGGAYQTELHLDLPGAVSSWLETVDAIPFESYTDLVEHRTDESRRADALLWFEEHGVEPDGRHVFNTDGATHAAAPLAVFTLLTAEDLGNGWHRADLDEHGVGVFTDGRDYRDGRARVFTLTPPDFEYANGVVALDGTPTKEMWELSLDTRLTSRPVLDDDERAEYIRSALNLNLIRTTEHVKTYNNAEYVNTDDDAALLEKIVDTHGARPSVISTTTALEEYDAEDVLQYVDETKHYGNILGSNEFDDTRLGALIGSTHYGDGFVKRWGAYANVAVDTPDRSDPEGRGTGLSYGAFGDKILRHMREHDTLQAAMRFGRDGNGGVVYVHTDTLPEWVPIAGEGAVLRTRSDGERRVVDAVEELGEATTATVAEHADLSRRQTFTHLERLKDAGYLSREQDPEDGRAVRWVDDGIHRVNENGQVQLDAVDLDDLTEEEVTEVARSSIYTWAFRNSPEEDARGGPPPGVTDEHADDRARTDGGRPPDPGD